MLIKLTKPLPALGKKIGDEMELGESHARSYINEGKAEFVKNTQEGENYSPPPAQKEPEKPEEQKEDPEEMKKKDKMFKGGKTKGE